jgi:hypothetical protein
MSPNLAQAHILALRHLESGQIERRPQFWEMATGFPPVKAIIDYGRESQLDAASKTSFALIVVPRDLTNNACRKLGQSAPGPEMGSGSSRHSTQSFRRPGDWAGNACCQNLAAPGPVTCPRETGATDSSSGPTSTAGLEATRLRLDALRTMFLHTVNSPGRPDVVVTVAAHGLKKSILALLVVQLDRNVALRVPSHAEQSPNWGEDGPRPPLPSYIHLLECRFWETSILRARCRVRPPRCSRFHRLMGRAPVSPTRARLDTHPSK